MHCLVKEMVVAVDKWNRRNIDSGGEVLGRYLYIGTRGRRHDCCRRAKPLKRQEMFTVR
jgi:hypothetical protein